MNQLVRVFFTLFLLGIIVVWVLLTIQAIVYIRDTDPNKVNELDELKLKYENLETEYNLLKIRHDSLEKTIIQVMNVMGMEEVRKLLEETKLDKGENNDILANSNSNSIR